MLLDFTEITASSIAVSSNEALIAADALIESLISDPDPSTYESVLGRLENASTIISDASGVGTLMARVHPQIEVRDAAVEWGERLAKWSSDLIFRDDVASLIRSYAETEDAVALTKTYRRLLEHWQRDLRRAGHGLTGCDRDKLHALRTRLIEIQVRFSANLDKFSDYLDLTRDELDGLSNEYISRLTPGESSNTYRVTLSYPDYLPFLRQATNRALRQALQFKFLNKAVEDNLPMLSEAVSIRQQIAALLEYPSWADYAIEVKMADGPDAVAKLYDSIVPGLIAKANIEKERLQERLDADIPGATLQPWDVWFYDNEQRQDEYGVNPDEVADYFPLQQVIDGMFEVAGDVFGLAFHRIDQAATWHPDVSLYEIRDREQNRTIAYFYTDLFPRAGKYGHAAAFSVVCGRREEADYRLPIGALVANFTKPTDKSPALLQHSEALTLFHEFGHILHFGLTTVDLLRFSGNNSEWDFVEAPSQIMENWIWEAEVLERFARHHLTGDPIPSSLVKRLIAARDLNIALLTLRQIYLGKVDLAIHIGQEDKDLPLIDEVSHMVTQIPFHTGTNFLAGFGHIMAGYDAGYYGYLWSMVYGDDMFSEFEQQGVLDANVGKRYRNEVLATGGSRDAVEHVRAFLGRDPSSEAFLRKLGLANAPPAD